jgi:hypothetical protein
MATLRRGLLGKTLNSIKVIIKTPKFPASVEFGDFSRQTVLNLP